MEKGRRSKKKGIIQEHTERWKLYRQKWSILILGAGMISNLLKSVCLIFRLKFCVAISYSNIEAFQLVMIWIIFWGEKGSQYIQQAVMIQKRDIYAWYKNEDSYLQSQYGLWDKSP